VRTSTAGRYPDRVFFTADALKAGLKAGLAASAWLAGARG